MALYIGLISGTSMDGVDAALLDTEGGRFSLAAVLDHPIPDPLHRELSELIRSGHPDAALVWQLDRRVGELFAEAALSLMEASGTRAREIRAIGSHGQTIAHEPRAPHPYTVQIGDPSVIAERTRITTVADFRRRDVAAGGEGAPLASGFHLAAMSLPHGERAVVNIGGIANITVLPASGRVSGFDSGPGNTLIDNWAERHIGTGMDRGGRWAGTGSVDEALLARLCSDPYFARTPPKSTGREYFNLPWLERILREDGRMLAPENVQRTLCTFTATTIARAIEEFARSSTEVLVCGGGAHNPRLMEGLCEQLKTRSVATTETIGIDPDWVEAAAFAWLARETLAGRPGNLPAVTGARHPVVLGAIHPA